MTRHSLRSSGAVPSVSVIIHFLDSIRHLGESIESVIRQTFTDWELLLVDGGSTDGSSQLAMEYASRHRAKIRYVSGGRNGRLGIFDSRILGAEQARAPILAHLDSDDIWHPFFLDRSVAVYRSAFSDRPGLAYCPMVYWWPDSENVSQDHLQPVPDRGLYEPPDLVVELVRDRYSRSPGNSAVVVGREIILSAREIAEVGRRATATEDQYLWSYIALRYPIFVTGEPLVHYRQWPGSTCALRHQEASAERVRHLAWLRAHISDSNTQISSATRASLLERLEIAEAEDSGRATVQDVVQESLGQTQAAARARMATQLQPLSEMWGTDRGLPLHRYYVEQFLDRHRTDIHGRVLEFQEDRYATRFGDSSLVSLDILHIDDSNPNATLVGDLTGPNSFQSDVFDCILCTFVLHVIFDVHQALKELHRMLKPGGTLLVAVPHVSMNGLEYEELWRFTPLGLQRSLEAAFGPASVEVTCYGNSLTSAGDFRGLVIDEFTSEEIQFHDERFAMVVCGRARKRSLESGEVKEKRDLRSISEDTGSHKSVGLSVGFASCGDGIRCAPSSGIRLAARITNLSSTPFGTGERDLQAWLSLRPARGGGATSCTEPAKLVQLLPGETRYVPFTFEAPSARGEYFVNVACRSAGSKNVIDVASLDLNLRVNAPTEATAPRTQRGRSPRVLILMYHSVASATPSMPDWCILGAAQFRAQLTIVRNGAEILPLSEVPARLSVNRADPAVVITFDDGYKNFADTAYPLLEAAEVPATVFITTGVVDTETSIWAGRLHAAIAGTAKESLYWQGTEFPLTGVSAREIASRTIQDLLKCLPQWELELELSRIERRLDRGSTPVLPPASPFRMLDRQSIQRIAASPFIEVGAHTSSHAILSLLSAENQRREIRDSVKAIRSLSGRMCRTFAYPNGRFQDFTEENMRQLRDEGIELAVTAVHGVNTPETDIFELRRIGIGADTTIKDFAEMIRQFVEGGGEPT